MPLYKQISQIVRDAILQRRVAVGSTLPTENDLVRQFRVSRITVRQALQELEAEGLIRRQRAKGTVVLNDRADGGANWAFDSLQDIVAFGERTTVRILSFKERVPPPDVRQIFGVSPAAALPCVHGTRLLRKEPISEFRFWLTPRAAGRITADDLKQPTLFSVLATRLGVQLTEARQTVWSELAGADVAPTLRIRRSDPILAIQRVYVADGQIPVEVAISRFRADRYRLEHVLRRRDRG